MGLVNGHHCEKAVLDLKVGAVCSVSFAKKHFCAKFVCILFIVWHFADSGVENSPTVLFQTTNNCEGFFL
jgi:hypothetical protein